MTQESAADLLVLHAVRIIGFADTPAIARRFGLDPAETEELLGDAEATAGCSTPPSPTSAAGR